MALARRVLGTLEVSGSGPRLRTVVDFIGGETEEAREEAGGAGPVPREAFLARAREAFVPRCDQPWPRNGRRFERVGLRATSAGVDAVAAGAGQMRRRAVRRIVAGLACKLVHVTLSQCQSPLS